MLFEKFVNEKQKSKTLKIRVLVIPTARENLLAKLRAEAERKGLDPNVWFNNVELIAARRIGRETVQYVSNILKYYVAYKLLEDKMDHAVSQ